MCVVSMINDHFYDKWTKPVSPQPGIEIQYSSFLTEQEIAALRKFIRDDLPEFKALLERARQYDIDNNEPDCELQEKRKRILDLAEELGVEIDFL